MTSTIKALAAAACMLGIAAIPTTVSAYESRSPMTSPSASVTGKTAPAAQLPKLSLLPNGAKTASEAKKIVVAGRRGRRWRRRGAGLAAGIIAGAAAAAILSGAARARYHRHYYYDDGYYGRCDRWWHRCQYGNRRACRKFYRRCD